MAAFTMPAEAQTKLPVAIELVLALDCSASVDRHEFELQISGLASAFRDADVLEAVENLKPFGVAIAITQWGGPGETRLLVPFTHVENARDAKAFGYRASFLSRLLRASVTSIATGINDSITLIEGNDFDGQRKVIDISGDGRDNGAASLDEARRRASNGGITVNGLSIASDDSGLEGYYRDQVIVGSDAFVEPAQDFDDFARAIKEKLLRELRPLGS
jgi:Protein of unknown function (DUF1194)